MLLLSRKNYRFFLPACLIILPYFPLTTTEIPIFLFKQHLKPTPHYEPQEYIYRNPNTNGPFPFDQEKTVAIFDGDDVLETRYGIIYKPRQLWNFWQQQSREDKRALLKFGWWFIRNPKQAAKQISSRHRIDLNNPYLSKQLSSGKSVGEAIYNLSIEHALWFNTKKVVTAFKKREYLVGIGTNMHETTVYDLLTTPNSPYSVDDWVHIHRADVEGKVKKPSARYFEELSEAVFQKTGRCHIIFIDDKEENVKAAANCTLPDGRTITGILFKNPEQVHRVLAAIEVL